MEESVLHCVVTAALKAFPESLDFSSVKLLFTRQPDTAFER